LGSKLQNVWNHWNFWNDWNQGLIARDSLSLHFVAMLLARAAWNRHRQPFIDSSKALCYPHNRFTAEEKQQRAERIHATMKG
jgi:hypothetical protein